MFDFFKPLFIDTLSNKKWYILQWVCIYNLIDSCILCILSNILHNLTRGGPYGKKADIVAEVR